LQPFLKDCLFTFELTINIRLWVKKPFSLSAMRRLKKGAVSYGRGTAIFLEPTRRKMLFEIKIENFQGPKDYTNKP
jgi:hypothetical protein